MGEAYFYHLTRKPLERTLPLLLGKARDAGWRIEVRGTDDRRMEQLDTQLWLNPEDGFLPHGVAGGAHDDDQPVLLTVGRTKDSRFDCLMTVDGAEVTADEVATLARVCVLFDGNDARAVDGARGQWKRLTGDGCSAQYWSEESGRWEMKSKT